MTNPPTPPAAVLIHPSPLLVWSEPKVAAAAT